MISSEMPFVSMQNDNCYKPTPFSSIREEKHQVLRQNPQTGSYFIPASCEFFLWKSKNASMPYFLRHKLSLSQLVGSKENFGETVCSFVQNLCPLDYPFFGGSCGKSYHFCFAWSNSLLSGVSTHLRRRRNARSADG